MCKAVSSGIALMPCDCKQAPWSDLSDFGSALVRSSIVCQLMFTYFWVAGDGDCGYRALACAVLEGAACNPQAACFLLRRMTQLHEELPSWARTTQSAQGLHIFKVGLIALWQRCVHWQGPSSTSRKGYIVCYHHYNSSSFTCTRYCVSRKHKVQQTCRAEDLHCLFWQVCISLSKVWLWAIHLISCADDV